MDRVSTLPPHESIVDDLSDGHVVVPGSSLSLSLGVITGNLGRILDQGEDEFVEGIEE